MYFPIKSDKPRYKFFIVNRKGQRIYFGSWLCKDYTQDKNETNKKKYIGAHKNREDWTLSGIDTAGFWAKHLLHNKESIYESYEDIRINYIEHVPEYQEYMKKNIEYQNSFRH